jgi:lysophospholipase L1-like esterase
VLYAGDNDLMSGRTPRQLERDFIDFVERVRRIDGNLRIAYIAIKPSPARLQLMDAARSANQRIERATEKLKGVDYIDIFTPMLDADRQPRADLFLEDRLHLNAEGYRLWTRLVAPYLR